MQSKKVLVIGLDGAPPKFIFDEFKDRLPNLSRLMDQGISGPCRSITPPITVPAWMCMMTSKDPGTLGLYGFRHRRIGTYDQNWIATSHHLKEPTIWDILAQYNKQSILLGIPLTYPPKAVNGIMVSDFLAPDTEKNFTYPAELKDEIKHAIGNYILDVTEFRTPLKDNILKELYQMTDKRFRLAAHFLKTKPWDFFMMVEMGPDRLHHALWKMFDKRHPGFEAGNGYEHCAKIYYQYLDGEIGKILDCVDESETMIFVVSDHGAKAAKSNFCVNDWLIQNGYLTLFSEPDKPTPIADCSIDFSKTKAWAWGGYYCRIFLNIKGREPQGIIPPSDVSKVKKDLRDHFQTLKDEHGEFMDNHSYDPHEIYQSVNGDPPDLLAIFDNLSVRPIASIGNPKLFIQESDIGPDDAVHDWDGIFLLKDPQETKKGSALSHVSILDIAPTLLHRLGISPPKDWQGKIIHS